jgi:hypothetical protein
MMGKVQELTVTKGKTIKAGDREEWTKAEYSVKVIVDDQSDLEAAKAHLEGLIDGWLTGIVQSRPATAPLDIFPKELRDLLVFEETRDCLIVKPKVFLGSENFAKIAAIVKEHGGEYVSQGKTSHFRLPKTAVKLD